MLPTIRTQRTNRRTRGSALLAASGTVFLLMFLGTAIVTTTLFALKQTDVIQRDTLAFNLAESGAERAIRWLKDLPYPPSGSAPIYPFGSQQTLGGGTYSVVVYPDPSNSGAVLKRYTIVAQGNIHGRTETVHLVLRQQSFGKYAYFTDREVSSISGGRIWFISNDKLRGPVHSNNTDGSNFQINWAANGPPIFEALVTGAGNTINYAPRRPASEADFLRIYRTGSRGYQLGVDPIPLPPSSDMQKEAAWGSSSGYPTANGVYVRSTGGIYVRGDASISMSVSGGNQVFAITQGTTTTTVTVNLATNTRTVQVGSGPIETVPGAGNGVLFCTGNITSLSGTIADNYLSSANPPSILARSAYTIAADVNAGRTITITNNVRYQSSPNPDLPINDPVNLRPGTLGIIARDVVVASNAPANLEINAVILAGSSATSNGSFYVQNFNTKTPTGVLKIIGGLIQKARGPVGTFNSSTGQIVTGYLKDYYYDPRLADDPPPFFPTTGLYDRVSWQRDAGN